MRIVHVVCTANFAGVESHVASLANQQSQDGDDVTVVGGSPSRMPAAGSFDWHQGSGAWEAIQSLRRIARPDILHAHMTRAELASTMAARGAPVVCTRHFARRRATSTRGLAAPLIASRIRAEIAVSDYVARAIESAAVVIPAGVRDQEAVPPAATRPKIVIVLQRLEAEKRPGDALQAFAASQLWQQGWRLSFVGGGSLLGGLRAQVEQLNLARHVDFFGYQADPSEHFSKARMLLAPCPIEAQGLAVLEAMSCALPVVAAAGGGHLESIGSVPNAALYDPRDIEAASRWLRRLAEDPTLSDTYGLALQQRQRDRFALGVQSRDIRRVYEAVL